MEKIKLSTLSQNTMIYVEDDIAVRTVKEILEDIENYRNKKLYTTKKYNASFNAEEVIEEAIENEYNNGMYEGWDDNILIDVSEKDIKDIQAVLDRILARSPEQNIAYLAHKLIEIDV